MELSFFRNYSSRQPMDSSLEAVVKMIREDGSIKALTESYRMTKDMALKEASPLFGVAAVFRNGKRKEDICQLTGLSLVDVDHVAAQGGVDSLKLKVERDPHTMVCYRTISGEGLRILFRYELDGSFTLTQQMQFYPKAFTAGNAYYAKLLGVETDGKCKNIGRLSGLAFDPEVFMNRDAVAFSKAEIEAHHNQEVQRRRETKQQHREKSRLQTAYERVIRPEVEADGAVYAEGSHNDYVMRVGYKLNQLGFTEDVAVEWAVELFADYDKTEEVIHACYQRTEEFGTRRYPATAERGKRTEGASFASVQEIQAFLSEHIRLRHNVITGRVECRTEMKNESTKDNVWEPITDRVVNSLWMKMSETLRVNIQDVYRVIESDFVPEFQPFKEYLEGIKNEKREVKNEDSSISQLARTVTVKGGEAEQRRFETYLRKWLVGMVAAWVDDTVVNNVILVLIGEQGAYKTTWFQYLLPPQLRRYFYTKTNANRMQRDDLLTLAQYGLVCCEELDTMRPAELNQLKAAVTMTAIDERAAYAHFHEHRAHIASFCGTGNNIQFLSDPTGNRRWLPFEIVSILSPREHPFDYEGIYAEAYELYQNGFQFWFSREEILELAEHNRAFETPRLEWELVQQHFRTPAEGERGEFMSVALALQVVSGGISQKLSAINMGRAFRDLGFEQKKIQNVRGYVVVRYTAEEMQARRQLAASL